MIVKYRTHPSILTKRTLSFILVVLIKMIKKKQFKLDTPKACQDSDIASTIIKENADIFTGFLHFSFNNTIYQFESRSILKLSNITPVIKKGGKF